MAMKILASKLRHIADEKANEEADEKRVGSPKAAFGNKYRRTFVLSQHPMVRDHVTGKSTIMVSDVLNGDLSYLS
jgi:protein subunit release factor B